MDRRQQRIQRLIAKELLAAMRGTGGPEHPWTDFFASIRSQRQGRPLTSDERNLLSSELHMAGVDWLGFLMKVWERRGATPTRPTPPRRAAR